MSGGVRETSIQALREIQGNGRGTQATDKILEVLQRNPWGLTRREIEARTGLRGNQVSGRVRELIEQKRAKEDGQRVCSVTGSMVGVVQLAPAQETVEDEA